MSQEPSGTPPSPAGPPGGAPPTAPPRPAAPPPAPAPGPTPPKSGTRGKALLIVAAIVVVIALSVFLYWNLVGRFHESTNDAYVNGNVVAISARESGTVMAILVDDTGVVTAGQVLVRLDPSDAQLAVEQAEATLVSEVRAVRQLFVSVDQMHYQVDADRVELKRMQDDLARRASLASIPGAVTDEDLGHAKSAVSQAAATLSLAQASEYAAMCAVQGTTVTTHPRVLLAASHLRQALLDLDRTTIIAPVAGVVDKRTVQLGQRIESGQALMAVIPSEQMWVDANFKESELRHVSPGQHVSLTSDLYGSSVTYHGYVVGLGAGTGAAFAVLPAQNASGNWIKIVQRLPARIGLQPDELASHPLRIGLSMDVEVDLEGGQLPLASSVTGQSASSDTAVPGVSEAIDKRVQAVISANLGSATPSQP